MLVFGVAVFARAQSTPSEYQIKSAYLYNFAKFVDWPPQIFNSPESPLTIGVLGDNVFGPDLEQVVQGKKVNGHPLVCRFATDPEQLTNAQIVFISPSEKKRVEKVLATFKDLNVLTVSQMEHFTASGGMVNFVLVDNKVRFQINDASARKSGLEISSKLLSLAIPDDSQKDAKSK